MKPKYPFRPAFRTLGLTLISFIFSFLLPTLAFADITSTNYSILGQFSGGGGSGSSVNYQVNESAVDIFSQPGLSSTNYQMGDGAEVFSTAGLASISSVSPENYPIFYSDSTADYTVSATDPDNDSLQYRAKQDGTIKDGPQAENELSWALSNNDLGRRDVELAVIDSDGIVVKNQNAYVVRRPVK